MGKTLSEFNIIPLSAGNPPEPDRLGRPLRDLRSFETAGSPVKHLMCWRRALGLEIGGMNEAVSDHGCDDYDFPWRMAEAGAPGGSWSA